MQRVIAPDGQHVMQRGPVVQRENLMRGTIFKTGATALFMSAITLNQALASCVWLGNCDSGDATAVPEINGPGALAALALLVSIGVIFYNKVRK